MANVLSYNTFTDDDTLVIPHNPTIPNGSTRISINAAPSKVSINAFTGEFVDHSAKGLNTAALTDSGKGYDIRSSTGSPIGSRPPKSDDIVSINGMETTYGVAVRSGLIAEDGALAPEKPIEKVQEKAPEVERMDEPTEKLLTELAQSTTPTTQVSALHEFTETGEVSEGAINRLASEAGIHPNDMRSKVEKVMAGFQGQADRALSAYATDPEAIYAWARKADPEGLKRATQDLTMQGSSKGFKDLGARYLETADKHSPELVEELPWAEGVSVTRSNGHIVVHYPGGSDRWSTLVKTGLLGSLMASKGSPLTVKPAVSSDWIELPTGRWFNSSTAEVADKPR